MAAFSKCTLESKVAIGTGIQTPTLRSQARCHAAFLAYSDLFIGKSKYLAIKRTPLKITC